MQIAHELSGEKEILKLSGELTIPYAAEFKAVLAKSLEQANHLTIELEDVTDADVSCFQLLCSAHRTSLSLNKHMYLQINGSEMFRKSMKAAGFFRHGGCSLNPGADCLWIGDDVPCGI